MSDKNAWTTSDIVENRNNWSLASDGQLLKHLQQLSQKLIDKSQSTLSLLKSFEDEVNQTCTHVSNIDNHFKSLSDTQFIESKVQDSPEIETNDITNNATITPVDQPSKNEDISLKLKKAVQNGIKVLDTHYDIITVTDSDSESEEPEEILLKARNPYMSRRLPHIIGSEEFTNYDHLGLVYTTSEDEEEDDEESDEELPTSIVPQTPKMEVESNLPKTQIIRVSSSDSENSEKSAPRSNFTKRYNVDELEKPSVHTPQTKKPQAQYSFADHLNATLQNYGANSFSSDTSSHVGDMFSPPPFPTKDPVETSSDDEKSDSSDGLNFAKDNPKKIAPQVIRTNEISDNCVVDDNIRNSSDKIDSFMKESPIMTKSKLTKLPDSSSFIQQTSQSAKSPISSANVGPQNQVMNAITAELNAKLKIPPRRASSSDDSESDLEPIPIKSQTEPPTIDFVSGTSSDKVKAMNDLGKEIKTTDIKAVSTPSKSMKVNAIEPNIDIFAATSSKATLEKPKSKKTFGLFDDDEDDDLDDLFKSKKLSDVNERISKASSFDAESENSNSEEKSTAVLGTNITRSSVGRKLALFDSDDSDSGDDIFAIINSQKRTSSKTFDKKSESNVTNVKNETYNKSVSNDDRNDEDVSKEENEIEKLASGDGESRNTTTFDSLKIAAIRNQPSGSVFDDVNQRRADVSDEEREHEETRSKNDDSKVKPVVERVTFGVFEESTAKMSSKSDENDRDANNVENETNILEVEKIQSVSTNEEKLFEDKMSDEGDGNFLAKNVEDKPIETSAELRPKPGKLTISRGLNINVNALIPGSRWSPKPKENDSVVVNEKSTVEENSVESAIDLKSEEVSKSVPELSTANITSVMKERAKISTKRRPPSRRARTSKIFSQDPFSVDIIADNDGERAEEWKTNIADDITETNKSEFPSNVERNLSSVNERDRRPILDDVFSSEKERKKMDFDSLFRSDNEEEAQNEASISKKSEKIKETFAFPPSKSLNTQPATSVLPSTTNGAKRMAYKPPVNENSASVLTGFIKDRRQLSQRQPLARKVDVAESNLEEHIPDAESADVESKPIESLIESTNTIKDIISTSDVVNLSPSSKKIDFKKLFEESDEEDDLFADVFSKSKSSEVGIQSKMFWEEQKLNVPEEESILKTDLTNSSAQASKPNDSIIEPISNIVEVTPVISSKSEEEPQPSLFASLDVNTSSTGKEETVTTKKQSASFIPKPARDLFADDDDDGQDEDDLFSKPSAKPAAKVEKVKNIVEQKSTSSIKVSDSKKKVDLFADDDNGLFSSSKKKFLDKSAPKKTSLFDDDDDDNDDLFGFKKTSAMNKSSSSSKKT